MIVVWERFFRLRRARSGGPYLGWCWLVVGLAVFCVEALLGEGEGFGAELDLEEDSMEVHSDSDISPAIAHSRARPVA